MRFRYIIAVLLALVPLGAQASYAVDYGSGTLGDWSQRSRSISTASTIRQVRAADGLYMMGDSISVSTGRQLAQKLLPSHDLLAVNDWSGRPTSPAADVLSTWVTTYGAPHRFLMAVGTNDIFNPPVMTAQIDRVMALAAPTRRVFWVSVYCSRWSKSAAIQAADRRNSIWVNSQIYAAAKRWPNLTVIPWDTWLSSKPSRYVLYLRDGVHTNAAGSLFRNTIISRAILQAAPA